jgi:hypothetical protein
MRKEGQKMRTEKLERKENTLSNFFTCELVKELRSRESVEAKTAEPYEDLTVTVNGPAVILIITD